MKRNFFILALVFILAMGTVVAPVAAIFVVNSVTQSKYNVSEQAGTVTINLNLATDVLTDNKPLTVDFENYKTISGNPVATIKNSTGDTSGFTVDSRGATGKTLTFNITKVGGGGMAAAESPFTLTITGVANIVNPTTSGNDVTITVRTAAPESGTKDITIAPIVTSINPSNRGSGSTSTAYVITGDGFTNGGVLATGVTIGSFATSTAVTYNDINTITATVDISGLAVGTKNVVVTNNGASGTGVNIFDINAKPSVASAATNVAGTNITITFNRAMANPAGKHAQFTYSIDGGAAQAFDAVSLNTGDTTQIFLRMAGATITSDNVVTVSYTAGDVIAADTGVLATFVNQAVTNAISVPAQAPHADNAASGGPAPVAPATTSTTDVNVGGDSAVSQVTITGTGVTDVIVTGIVVSGPGEGNAAPSGGPVYEYMDITAARYTTISEAIITFFVPVSWLEENHVTPQNVVMNHQVEKTWNALPTTYVKTANGKAEFTAVTETFSRFAIIAVINSPVNVTVTRKAPDVQTFGEMATPDTTTVAPVLTSTPPPPVTQITTVPVTPMPAQKNGLTEIVLVLGTVGAVVLIAVPGIIRRRK